MPDASANPYLATAALIAAGLDGIDRRLDPGAACTDDLFQCSLAQIRERGLAILPQGLGAAIDALERDAVICDALGDTLSSEFIRLKRSRVDRLRPPRQPLGDGALRPMPSERPPALWLSYLSLASGMAVVGAYVGFSKLLVVVFPVFLLAWLRFGIAAVAMAGWVRRGPGELPIDARDRRLLFLESFFGNFPVLDLHAVRRVADFGAGRRRDPGGDPGGGGDPVAACCCTSRSPREWPPASPAAWPASRWCRFSRTTGTGAAVSVWGNLLLVGAVLCEATYVVVGKKLTGRVSAKRISALVNLWGLVLVTPFGLWQANSFDFGTVPIASWGLLVVYSLAASMITVWLWMSGLKHVPASSAGVFTVLLPISAAVVGVVLLGERFSAPQLGAFALALAGVVLATWPGSAAARQPA